MRLRLLVALISFIRTSWKSCHYLPFQCLRFPVLFWIFLANFFWHESEMLFGLDVRMGLGWAFYMKTITENQLCEQILSSGKILLWLQMTPHCKCSLLIAFSGLMWSFLIAPLPFVPPNSNKTRRAIVQMEGSTQSLFQRRFHGKGNIPQTVSALGRCFCK